MTLNLILALRQDCMIIRLISAFPQDCTSQQPVRRPTASSDLATNNRRVTGPLDRDRPAGQAYTPFEDGVAVTVYRLSGSVTPAPAGGGRLRPLR